MILYQHTDNDGDTFKVYAEEFDAASEECLTFQVVDADGDGLGEAAFVSRAQATEIRKVLDKFIGSDEPKPTEPEALRSVGAGIALDPAASPLSLTLVGAEVITPTPKPDALAASPLADLVAEVTRRVNGAAA